ncbi:MAG: ImuA family protein [Devosia sp.]
MLGMKLEQREVLRARIAQIERRPMLAEGAAPLQQQGEQALLSAPGGLLHEVFADERRNAGAALGFTLAQARELLSAERPAVIFLQLAHAAQEVGLPYGPGLTHFGFPPESLILGRVETIVELLWAMEEAIACRAVAAVIADVASHPKALDFTASRRLNLRAASAGTSAFLMRYGTDREASAAHLRWRVSPAMSGERMFDARAPGEAHWQVTIEKVLLSQERRRVGETWLLRWTKNGFDLAKQRDANGKEAAVRTAVLGAFPAALGDRLSQTA